MTKETVQKKRKLQGVVVSNKMDKTAVVSVLHYKWHSKYKKQYTTTRKFKAHDEGNEYMPGDKVIIEECRPYSKEKRWKVVEAIERAAKKSKEVDE